MSFKAVMESIPLCPYSKFPVSTTNRFPSTEFPFVMTLKLKGSVFIPLTCPIAYPLGCSYVIYLTVAKGVGG